jgi:hypothetical protein
VKASSLTRKKAEHRFTFHREDISRLHRSTVFLLFAITASVVRCCGESAAVIAASDITFTAVFTSELVLGKIPFVLDMSKFTLELQEIYMNLV